MGVGVVKHSSHHKNVTILVGYYIKGFPTNKSFHQSKKAFINKTLSIINTTSQAASQPTN
jgi:hypothetical protein